MKISATNRDELRAAIRATNANHAALISAHVASRDSANTPAATVSALVASIGYDAAVVTVAELVNTVGDWDGRVSSRSRSWAASVSDAASRDELHRVGIYTPGEIHPAHVGQIAAAMASYTPAPAAVSRRVVSSRRGVMAAGKISVSPGNSKMGAIPSVSLPPVVTCAAGCKCAQKCYAAKLCRLRPSVRAAYDRNLSILTTDPASYWLQVKAAASVSRFFRFHVSGDIPGPEYLGEMLQVCKDLPGTQFLCFTKRFDLVNKYAAHFGVDFFPANLHLIFSAWPGMPMDNPHNFPVANVIFKGQSPAENWKICGGNCAECACAGVGCWELKAGENIAFYEH